MGVTYTESQITEMMAESKPLANDWKIRLAATTKSGHDERQMEIVGAKGNGYVIIIRKSLANPLDFSIILGVRIRSSNRVFRLRRYNGRSHEHTNRIEGNTFYDFHIHIATERYQELGHREPREDGYAIVTNRYNDATTALECLIADANFEVESGQGALFMAGPEV